MIGFCITSRNQDQHNIDIRPTVGAIKEAIAKMGMRLNSPKYSKGGYRIGPHQNRVLALFANAELLMGA